MIKWEKVAKDLKKIFNENCYVDGVIISHYGYGTEENPVPSCFNREGFNNMISGLSKYFQSLIAKEFKLVAKGKARDSDLMKNIFKEYKGKNISIYIREEK